MKNYKMHVPFLLISIFILGAFISPELNSVLSSGVSVGTLSSVMTAFVFISLLMVIWYGIGYIYTKIFTEKETDMYEKYVLIGAGAFLLFGFLGGVLTSFEASICCDPSSLPEGADASDYLPPSSG